MDGRPNRRNKAAFSNSSGLKSVFEKLRFRAGLVWTVGLTVEIKRVFKFLRQILDVSLIVLLHLPINFFFLTSLQ